MGWDDLQGRGRCDFEKHFDNANEIRVRVSHGPRIYHPSSMCFLFELAGVQHISRSERPMLGSCSEDAQRLSMRGRIGGSLRLTLRWVDVYVDNDCADRAVSCVIPWRPA